MTVDIALIVGLSNPGPEYAQTRHNAGSWFIEGLATHYQTSLKAQPKLHGSGAEVNIAQQRVRVFIPATYMNHSGNAVSAVSNYFKIPPEQILIIHDDIDLPPGAIRYKHAGGHGGHNGLRDIDHALGSNHYHRLRIGVGHPGNKHDVVNYVLHPCTKAERATIDASIDTAIAVLPKLLSEQRQQAVAQLHSLGKD